MLSESKQMNSVPICGMHAIRIQSSVHSISRILRTTYNPFNILRTFLKAKRRKKRKEIYAQNILQNFHRSTRTKKKKKLVIRITITITPYQSWPIRSEDFEEDDLTGRIIERTLNQVFHPVVNRMVTSKRLSGTACAYYVCVSLHQTKRAYVCSRVCDREYAALRACINSFQLGVLVGPGEEGVCGWDSWPRVSVCACIEVGVRGNGKGSRGTITEPRFRATTRRHPFNLHPLPCSKPTGNPPFCFISFSSSLLPPHASLVEALRPPFAKRTKT